MKKPSVTLALALALAPAWSGEAPAPVDRLVACADVQDPAQRLTCFDREIAPLAKARAASAPPAAAPPVAQRTAPATPTPTPPSPPAPPAASLGEEQLSPKLRAPVNEDEQVLHAHISALRAQGPSTFVVALDNGQTWRHEDQHLGSYLRVGDAITIRKATLGTYRLTRDAGETRNWIRVTRVR
jgi:hypothetical protein